MANELNTHRELDAAVGRALGWTVEVPENPDECLWMEKPQKGGGALVNQRTDYSTDITTLPEMLAWLHKIGVTVLRHCVSPPWVAELTIIHRAHVTTEIEAKGVSINEATARLVIAVWQKQQEAR